MIAKLSRNVDKKGIMYSHIEIQTKDFREVTFRFQQTQKDESENFYAKIIRAAFPEDITSLFAF